MMTEFCRICENTTNIHLMSQETQQQFTELTGTQPNPYLWICKFCQLNLDSACCFRNYVLETDRKLKLKEIVNKKPKRSISSQIYALSNGASDYLELSSTAKVELEVDTSQNQFFVEAYPDITDETTEEENTKDSFDFTEPPQSKQKKAIGLCYSCRETSQIRRKSKKACTDCSKPICNEHSKKFTKCSSCDTLTGLEVEIDSMQGHKDSDGRIKFKGNCYSCRQLWRKQRKTRKGCNRCRKPVCNEHSVTFAKCHTCLSSSRLPLEVLNEKIEPE